MHGEGTICLFHVPSTKPDNGKLVSNSILLQVPNILFMALLPSISPSSDLLRKTDPSRFSPPA